jgi:hypothetical protein
VVSLPAVQAGLDLDQRVVRRHVARLEAAGWLVRAPWVWGEGSVVRLTGGGIEGAGLGGVRPVKAPPGPTTIARSVLVGWSAARVERRGRTWKSARELAVDPDRWAVRARCERGYTTQLPDLAVWLKRSAAPVAVIAESGGRREDRQKMILEGWRDAILTGRYGAVRYDCASVSVAQWISRLAKKVQLTGPAFRAAVQMSAGEIAVLSPVVDETNEMPVDKPQPSAEAMQPLGERVQIAAARTPAPAQPTQPEQRAHRPQPRSETPEQAAKREQAYREIFGPHQPERRRRWQR